MKKYITCRRALDKTIRRRTGNMKTTLMKAVSALSK